MRAVDPEQCTRNAISSNESRHMTSQPERDDRKTATVVAAQAKPRSNSRRIESFAKAREVLRDKAMVQAGGGAEYFDTSDPASTPS